MLLCLSRLPSDRDFRWFGWLLRAGKTGMGRSCMRAGFYQVTEFQQLGEGVPGRPADRSKAGTSAAAESRARPPRGPGVSRVGAGDPAGEVPLQAADDLLLGQPRGRAPLGA